MSNGLNFDFALQEPAMAIAPVFLVLRKVKERQKLQVAFSFGDAKLEWRGTDALGMVEQSVLLGLLSAAGQQLNRLSPSTQSVAGQKLLLRLGVVDSLLDSDLAALKISWNGIVAASGYESHGGKYIKFVRKAVKRLAETTIWEKRQGKEHQSRILAWIEGDKEGVTMVLNPRATDALCGGQFVKISLSERRMLADDPAKALHAWLSGHLRPGSSRVYTVSVFQSHVWGGEACGSTLRTRLTRLRSALLSIGQLEAWDCKFISKEKVQISRTGVGTIVDKSGNLRSAPGTFTNSKNSGNMLGKSGVEQA